MDYTLAQYRPETFEVLAYNLTVDKLVDVFGYPSVRPCTALLARSTMGQVRRSASRAATVYSILAL